MTDHLDELDQVLQGGSSDEPFATASLLRRAATLPEATPAPELLAAMAHEAGSAVDPTPHPSRRRSMLATKVATAAAAIALTATGAAAAAGDLPDAAQDGIAEAGTHLGLNLPESADDEARDATTFDTEASVETESETETQEVEGDEVEGQGHTERGNQTNPTDADAHGEAVSSVATDDSLTGAEKGAAVSATARGDVEGGPDDAGAPAGTSDDQDDASTGADNAPVETPNEGSASADARAEAGAED